MHSSEESESTELNTNQKLVLASSFVLLLVALYFIIWGNKPYRIMKKKWGRRRKK
jgi:hypothetical protein